MDAQGSVLTLSLTVFLMMKRAAQWLALCAGPVLAGSHLGECKDSPPPAKTYKDSKGVTKEVPKTMDPPVQQPVQTDPPVQQPVQTDPPVQQPVQTDPPVQQPVQTDPPVQQPVQTDPPVQQPVQTNPPVQQPVQTNPPVVQTNPPVVQTNPPVVQTNPPVVQTDPPVTQTPVPQNNTRMLYELLSLQLVESADRRLASAATGTPGTQTAGCDKETKVETGMTFGLPINATAAAVVAEGICDKMNDPLERALLEASMAGAAGLGSEFIAALTECGVVTRRRRLSSDRSLEESTSISVKTTYTINGISDSDVTGIQNQLKTETGKTALTGLETMIKATVKTAVIAKAAEMGVVVTGAQMDEELAKHTLVTKDATELANEDGTTTGSTASSAVMLRSFVSVGLMSLFLL